MNTTPIHISWEDYRILSTLIRTHKETFSTLPEPLIKLQKELNRSVLVDSEHLPDDVIALNRTARLKDLDEEDIMEFQLVLPHLADTSEGRISILAPIGIAMLGYRKGDTISWEVPGGSIRLEVLEVHATEAMAATLP